MYTAVGPLVDDRFSGAVRRQLDKTSWVEVVPGWMHDGHTLLNRLVASVRFEQRRRWMYNRLVDEPRLTAEYRDLASAPEPDLRILARSLSRHYGVTYDAVWINLYRNERDSTGWHGDWPTCKRDECIVPVLSLGATRRFLLKPRSGGSSIVLSPTDGDLVVMGGRCQTGWRHCVPKQAWPAGMRISINFSSSAQATKGPGWAFSQTRT
jgi:alkylated DNA repair dioxygenase AlkB